MEHQEKSKYEMKPGSISFFAAETTDTSTHNFFGTLITVEGAEKKLRMFIQNSLSAKIYLLGNIGDSNKEVNELSKDITRDQVNSIVLFLNEMYVPVAHLLEGQKEKPYYTGFYIDEFGAKFEVSCWLKISKQNTEYFSGIIKVPNSNH